MSGRLWGGVIAALLLLIRGNGLAAPQARIKTVVELRLELLLDSAYRSCFRSFFIAGKPLLLRIPFGQNEERIGRSGLAQYILLGGKGMPEQLWEEIDFVLSSEEFFEYIRLLQQPGEKVIEFDLEQGSYWIYHDPVLAQLLKGGSYPGTRTHVYFLKTDCEITEIEVYNYLYCVGCIGLDCSGFVYFLQKSIAAACGYDLDKALADDWRIPAERTPETVGLWFFDPQHGYTERVEDTIERIRPGDIFLFRSRKHRYGHSAVIQSIDGDQGIIRYFQCTDWAPQPERGVHESQILFDPLRPFLRLSAPGVWWTQKIQPTFPGEPGLRHWRNDGDRYRSYWEEGGSIVVRLRLIRDMLQNADPGFYAGGPLDPN